MTDTYRPPSLDVGVYPGAAPGPLDPEAAPAVRGYRGEDLLRAIEAAGLRGRGGAAFPTVRKLRAVAGGPAPRYVVANGEEGEPASVKDRWLLRNRPHLVLDGLLRAAEAVGADAAYAYVSDPAATVAVERALAELGETPVPVIVHQVAPGYVAGEETAVVRAIDGGPAKPLDKPPRPYEQGVGGRPTAVCNVETLARVALVAAGHPADAFLLTVSGTDIRPGLFEVPYGVTLGTALDALTGAGLDARGYLMGGFFAGLAGPAIRDVPLDPDALRAHGSGLGCGAVVVIGADDCPVAAAADVMAYFAAENAGQCGSCIRGTAAMSDVLTDLTRGTATADRLARLEKWSGSLPGRGACGTLDGASALTATLLSGFPADVEAHLGAPCPRCAALSEPNGRTRFAVPPESIIPGGHL